jgi:hypothetical protein
VAPYSCGVTDHHYGAPGVVNTLLPDRAEQCLRESAMAAAADHEQIRAGGCIHQRAGGVALDDLAPDGGRVGVTGDSGDGVGDCPGRKFREVGFRDQYGISRAVRQLPGRDCLLYPYPYGFRGILAGPLVLVRAGSTALAISAQRRNA